MIKWLLGGLLFLAFPAFSDDFRHFSDWSKKEKIAFISYNTAVYIDLMQTKKALQHPCKCYKEGNSIYGNDPSIDKIVLANLATSALLYYSVGVLEKDKLNTALFTLTAIRVGVVYRNDSIGISWTAGF
jgi:hypothetical protein